MSQRALLTKPRPFRDSAQRGLVEDGYAVDIAADGRSGYDAAIAGDYDAVVLDVMLPGMSGFDVCEQWRNHRIWVPVLMLTAHGAVADRVAGLDGGADD